MPRTGDGFVGLFVYRTDVANMREYAQVQLTQPLESGKCYLVEFFVNTPNDHALVIDRVGAMLSTGPVSSIGAQPIGGTVQVENTAGQLLTDTMGWTRISGHFMAAGGEDHITIGNFNNDTQTMSQVYNPGVWYAISSYLYIDDVRVEEVPLDVYLGADTSICVDETLVLDASTNADTYHWNNGYMDSVMEVNQSGVYSVVVKLGGCAVTDSIEVNMIRPPQVHIEGEDTFCSDESILLIAKSGHYSIPLWSTGHVGDTIVVQDEGIYSVTVTGECGTETAIKRIIEENCFCEVYIPNAFTPNNDEDNEVFGLESECQFLSFSFIVFNRWGQEVFVSQNPSTKWDGTYKGVTVESGMYAWIMSYVVTTQGKQETVNQQGTIRLIR